MAASLARGEEQVLVAESEAGSVQGVAALQVHQMLHRGHPTARLTVLVVDAEVRRTGLGGLLLREVLQRARLAGCEGVELTSALTRREAHEFYLRQGFTNTSAKFWLPLT
ncbi:MAG: GNAT family N-acetyltransferase [Candidatus Dormibacteraceae bacterium]